MPKIIFYHGINMNIGMLLNAPYPSDVRVHKEAKALLAAGHKVFLLCIRRVGEKKYDSADGIQITRIDGGSSTFCLAFWDIILSVSFLHPVFYYHIARWIAENQIDVLHVHDLPLAGTALRVKRKSGIRVVVDLHENYPDALGVWFSWKKNPLAQLKNTLFMNPERWRKHEGRAVKEASKVIAVVEEMRERLLRDYGIEQEKVVVVTNTEEKSFIQQPLFPDVYDKHKGNFIVAYTGNIGPHRGVDTVIEAMALLKNQPIHFVISGKGNAAVMNYLHKLVKQHGLEKQVFFYGHQPFNRFYSLMHYADVNIIPHKSNAHTNHTIPHKLFQAMMAGKPLIVSSCFPLKRIVEATRAGLIYRDEDTADCASKILELFHNPELSKTLGTNGVNATLNGAWNWEHTSRILTDLYNSLDHE
ncbi:MAG: glycosyltransferase family 4 protein [Cyclobacteriaceae bacterium]|nr:glycosyltransferase family 4 protein [Cyclobacteriaceae bacterium]